MQSQQRYGQDEELQEIEQIDEGLGQQQYFKVIQEKLKSLPEQVQKYKNIGNISKFQQILVDEINQQMDTLNKYLNYFKIYVVFMGTLSAGKSTFINALLGQQLLPSKNQSCTSQVTFIAHQNTNANEDNKITINGQEFDSLDMASQKLAKIQEEAFLNQKPMGTVNIKTQSYFHKTLDKDLQDKVFFIDTPGIELSKTTPKQYLDHFGKINQLIQLDEYSVRINLWILNYTTFDSDKELQKNMNFMTKNEDEQVKNQNIGNQQQKQKLPKIFQRPSSEFFYILNKYEYRLGDNPKEKVFDSIKLSFNSAKVFMISAQKALQFNVMTFGTDEAQDKFILTHYHDNEYNFDDKEEAKFFCNKRFKNQPKLFDNQDFNQFTEQINIEIQNQLVNLFQYKLEKFEQVTQLLNQSEKLANEKIQHFNCILDKMNVLQEEAQKHKNIQKIQELQMKEEEKISQEIDIMDKCSNHSKIYIVFMGTHSSGKSTFINSLLGQQLLPSKCTSQVTYIQHLNANANANQNTKITINGQEFDTLEQASEKLTQIQVNPQMAISTQLVQGKICKKESFSLTRKDIIHFISPGIELSKATPEQYLQHICQINELIKLDECSIRINLWILNFDNEVNELQQNIFKIKKQVEKQKKRELANQQQELVDYLNSQISSFFFIINKFDINKIIDIKLKKKVENIHNFFYSENIFKISAQDALIYNVMNQGSLEAQQSFLQSFKNNEQEFNQIDDLKEYCKNPYLIQLQDFNKFTSQISLEIQNQLNNLYEQRLIWLDVVTAQMDQKKQSMKQIIDQNQLLTDEIIKLKETFWSNMVCYDQELYKYHESFFQSIEDLIDMAIQQIDRNEKQPFIEKTCIETICKIDELTKYFLDITKQYTDQLLDQLKLESLVDPDQFLIFHLESQHIIKFFLQYKISEYKDQFVKSQVEYVYDKMNIRSYRTTWESFLNLLGIEYKQSQEIKGSISLSALIAHYYVQDNSRKSIDKDLLKGQMGEWKGLLKNDIKLYVEEYVAVYQMALINITQTMNALLN